MAVLVAISLAWLGSSLGPLGLVSAQPAASSEPAQGGVLLLEAETLRPDLCAALRIQLTDVAEVRCRAEAAAGSLAERIASASRAVVQERLRLAVLLERDPDATRVRMLLVGAAESQAVLAIESIEDRPAPDVDRSLALKVRDSLEVLNTSAAQAAAPEAALALTLATRPEARADARGRAFALLFEPGVALSVARRTRAAGLLGVGVRLERNAGYGELVLRGQVSASLREQTELGSVVEDEWELALSLRAGRMLGRLSLGALGELGLVRIRALGLSRDGETGERSLALLRLGLGLDLRLLLWRGAAVLWLRGAPTLQIDPVEQRFAIDHQQALALGRVHAWLPLSLLIELPLGRWSER